MTALAFINSIFLLLAGALVAFSTNPVNSAVFLIATFVNAAFLLFFLSVDFLSLVFIVVYVGAIAVLFLFVVMMLAIKEREINLLNISVLRQLFIKACAGFCLILFLLLIFETIFSVEDYFAVTRVFFVDNFDGLSWFGQLFYNNFDSSFLIAGLILLVALMGAILLTHNFLGGLTKQNFLGQLSANNKIAINFKFFFNTKKLRPMFTGVAILIFCLTIMELIGRCFFTVASDVTVDSVYNLLTNCGLNPVIVLILFSLFLLFSLLLFCLPVIFAYYKYDPFYKNT